MNINSTSKAFLKNILILFGAELLIGIAFYLFVFSSSDNLIGYIAGLTMGSLCSMIKIRMLDSSANRVVDMDSKDAAKYFKRSYYIRYFLTIGVMLFIALNHPAISIYGGAIGLINMSLAAYLYKFTNRE